MVIRPNKTGVRWNRVDPLNQGGAKMPRDGMKFVGMITKTNTKYVMGKDDAPAQRVMQITIEVAGEGVDQVATNLLQFGAAEDLNVEIQSRQLDMLRDENHGRD